MNRLLGTTWFSLLILAVAAALAVRLLIVWQRRRTAPLSLLLPASALGLVGLGGILAPFLIRFNVVETSAWAWWMAGGVAVVLFGMLLVVVMTGRWSAILGYTVGGILLLAVG